MPNHNNFVYDYHEHNDDHIHRAGGFSHIHDRHPFHQHDRNGSIHYHDSTRRDLYRTVDRPWEHDDIDNGGTNAPVIGSGGYDYTRRTT